MLKFFSQLPPTDQFSYHGTLILLLRLPANLRNMENKPSALFHSFAHIYCSLHALMLT